MPKEKKAKKKRKFYAIYIIDDRDCANPALEYPSLHAMQIAQQLRSHGTVKKVFDCSNSRPRFRVTGKINKITQTASVQKEIKGSTLKFRPEICVKVEEFKKGVLCL